MPIFKSTQNILKIVDQDEVFNPNWMNSGILMLPENTEWDYSRELTIEDVNIWEVICEGFNGCSVYASYDPLAEFYMIVYENNLFNIEIETFYGAGSMKKLTKKMKEFNIPIPNHKVWVEPEKMWLYF